MRSAATVIAELLPPEVEQAIRQVIRDKELLILDEQIRPVVNPELPRSHARCQPTPPTR
jgi:hypothetical protein